MKRLVLLTAMGSALIVLALVLFNLASNDLEATTLDGDMLVRITIGLGMIVLIGGSAWGAYRGQAGQALTHSMAWLAIAVALVGGYTYRFDVMHFANRVTGALLPGTAIDQGNGTVTITRQGDDSFILDGDVNGQTTRFVFDTGADSVVLTAATASALSLRIKPEDYTITIHTANGTSQAAPVRLNELRFGSIAMQDVTAMVARPGSLAVNLLGMSFLSRLTSYTVAGDRLTLQGR